MIYTSPVDVFLMLTRGGEVLLALRQGTGYADGQWNFPSGKLESGESVVDAVRREAAEEIGVKLDPGELGPPAVLHYRSPGEEGRVGVFFQVEHDAARHGEPVNAEPGKCGGLRWCSLGALPDDTVPYTVEGHRLWLEGRTFGLAGW